MRELDEFADELFAAAPALAGAMEEDGADPSPDHEIPSLWLGEVGSAIMSLPEPAARAALGVVERHLTGSETWKDVLCTGLLEAVAGAVSSGQVPGRVVAEMLGPRSRAYVDAWDEFTLGRSSLG